MNKTYVLSGIALKSGICFWKHFKIKPSTRSKKVEFVDAKRKKKKKKIAQNVLQTTMIHY